MWSDVARAAEITPIGSAWLPILFDAAIKGAVVVGLAGAATLLMRRCSAAARHLVWCLAVASLPLLPILSAVSPDWHVLPRWMALSTDMPDEVALAAAAEPTATREPTAPREPTATQEAVLPGDRANMAEAPIEPAAPQPTPPHVVEQPEADRPATTAPPRPPDPAPNQARPSQAVPWQTWGLLIWLVGTLLTLVPVGLGMLSLWRLRRTAEPVTGGPWISQLHQLAARLGVSRRMVLLRSHRRSMPMHWGILRPKLLLPAVADRWPDDRRRVVLLHELAHVKRFDCLTQLVTQLACALYWFNPLVWVALRQMHLEREAACDDLILRAGYQPPDYAQHLLQIASGLQTDLFATYSAIAIARPSRLESRLRAILDAGRNRRTLTRAAVSLIIVLLAGVVVPVAMMRAAVGQNDAGEDRAAEEAAPTETSADGGTYDHFLYVRHNQKGGVAKTDTLVLARVTSGGFEQRDLYTKNNFNIGWRPLCVIDGTVYGVKIDDLIAIDVATGRAERICSHVRSHAYNAGRLYTIVPTGGDKPVLRVFDFHKRAYRDLGPVDVGWSRPPIAVSPDHKRLAFFEGLGNVMPASSFRLHVVDLKTGRVETPGPTVHSITFMTGGGDVCDGPPFVWLDPKTILLVHDVPKNVPKDPARFISFSGGEVGVATMDVTGGKLTDLLKLPRWQRRLREPYLRPLGKDGVPRIVMGELGQYRIDIRAKRLIEDDQIRGDYRWSRGREPERLGWRKTRLIEAERIPEVAASPDGRRLVWLTQRGSTDAELRYHDVDAKAVRVVAEGWFPTIWEPHRRPEETIFLWTDAQDLAPAEPAEPAAGWRRFSTQPWPVPPDPRETDKRRNIADFLTMTLSTDQRAYKHHQPVKLTVTLTNNTDEDVTFERPYEHSNFFGLRVEYPHGSTMIDEFERSQEVFPIDPFVIKVGDRFQCTRTLEPRGLGEHQVEGAFRLQTGNWRGRAKAATIQFVVEKSPDEDRLLKAKFDRFLAQCRREFQNDPMTCDYARFFDLGPAAVPHLVAALEASDDAKFRRRMGYALARMANTDALPYFEKLLKGEMKTDSEMVLEGLLTMYQRSRSPDQALRLLLEALKHSNAAVRRGAAERLSQIYDRRVAAGFERAVADADKRTAVTAARYLAAYEGLDLADWLALAAQQPTAARCLAAPSIIEQLEKRWDLQKGDLPDVAREDLAKDPAKLGQYQKVLRAWQEWARENPRSSAHFFDADREHWPKKEPKPDRRDPVQHIRSLIEQLGDSQFARREAAQQELVQIGIPAVAALKGAFGHKDPEIVNRVRLALAEINKQIDAQRQQHREAAEAAVRQSDRAAATRHYRALLALPDPPLGDCRDASRFFKAAEDWASYAVAQEATARSMKHVIHTPVEKFIRPAPPSVDPGARETGPIVQVQTRLDGQWHNGKGTAESWIPWVTRKQKQMVTDRFDLLLQLGRLCRDRLHDPKRAAAAYSEALADVPFCTEPLKKVIARHWPVRSGKLRGSWGTMAGNYIMAMHELSEMQQELGILDAAIETKTRKLLMQFNLGWNYRDGLVSRSARQLCELLRMLPADAPLPPLFWLNVLSPEKDTVTIDLSRPKAQRDTSDIYHPNVVARPGYVFDTLQVTADMESQGGSGVLDCYTVFEKTTSLARLQWDKGRKRITETFKVPPEAGLIRFEARDSQGFRVRQIRVKATFRPSPARSGTTPVARPQPRAGEATSRPATPPAQDAAASGWGEASGPLRCKIVPSGTQIVAGQPLTFRLVVQNVGKESVLLNNRIGTRVAFHVNDRFVSQEVSLYDGFAFRQPADDPRVITVPPGRSVEAALPLGVLTTTRLTDVANKRIIDSTANPGTYKIHALYAQRGAGGYPARWWRGTVRSPAVEIKVLPARPTKSFPATPAASPGNGRDLSRE